MTPACIRVGRGAPQELLDETAHKGSVMVAGDGRQGDDRVEARDGGDEIVDELPSSGMNRAPKPGDEMEAGIVPDVVTRERAVELELAAGVDEAHIEDRDRDPGEDADLVDHGMDRCISLGVKNQGFRSNPNEELENRRGG